MSEYDVGGVARTGTEAEVGEVPTTWSTGEIKPGRRVEVRNRYDQRWTRGFEVLEVVSDGYIVRRLSDGAMLPITFSPDEVRRERRPGLWWA